MTTTEPAWYRIIECEEEPFPKRTAVIEEGPGIEEKCGGFLLEGLADTDHMAEIMARHGREKVSDFIRWHKMPNKLNIRVANFGEVIFGRLLEGEEGFTRPIEKLRYTFNYELSPHLTDVFALVVEDDEITHFVYSEVKSGTTRPNSDVGASGYGDLVKISQQDIPKILYFTHERLDQSRRYEDRDRLGDAMFQEDRIPSLFRLGLVFDEDAWHGAVMDAVETAFEQDPLPDNTFVCYLVTKTNLRSLVNDSFEKMDELSVTK